MNNPDLTSFNKFVTSYQQRFIRFAFTYTHNEMVAEDVVIESMMYYWENRERLPDNVNVPAYVLTAIKHKCLNYLSRQQISQRISEEYSQVYEWELQTRITTLEDFEPDEIFTDEIQRIVDRTLEKLPEQTRKVFVMSRYENKSHKEIAEILGISTKGVEFHISKSMKELRQSLKDYLPAFLFFFSIH
jgi:RNA polymerase sigma factor, sigma-70 family/RNA polymerase sigma-70 factor, Bacteroides expansion family 1